MHIGYATSLTLDVKVGNTVHFNLKSVSAIETYLITQTKMFLEWIKTIKIYFKFFSFSYYI